MELSESLCEEESDDRVEGCCSNVLKRWFERAFDEGKGNEGDCKPVMANFQPVTLETPNYKAWKR